MFMCKENFKPPPRASVTLDDDGARVSGTDREVCKMMIACALAMRQRGYKMGKVLKRIRRIKHRAREVS